MKHLPSPDQASTVAVPSRRRALAAVAGVLVAVAGCASAPDGPGALPRPDPALLVAAGFKVVDARTPEDQLHIKSMAPGRITELQDTGRHFFVYPDLANNRVYVGTPKEYQAFLGRDPGYAAAVGRQQAADLHSYNRQDAAMAMYTTRDYNDPYYFWPSYVGLWQPLP